MRFHRNVLLVLALSGVVIAPPALAQQASDYPPPCDGSKMSRSDVERAHTVFLSGKQFLEESNYDKAISYFKDAYSIDCSVHAMLPIIATAYERKGDKGEAVRALEEYLRRAPSAADHDVIERRIKNLKDQLAREQPPVAVPAPPPSASAPPPPPAVATTEGIPTANAPPTTTDTIATPPQHAEGKTIFPWVTVGVGGAMFATGVVLYVVGVGDINSASKSCSMQRVCTSQGASDQGNSGRQLEQVGGPLIGAGVAVAAAGLIWHFLERPADKANVPPTTGTLLTPVFAPGYEGVALHGAF